MKMVIGGSKWLATVASIWIQCSCGASYTFAIYSSVLKSSQGYDQSTLDTVSVFKDIGANAGILAGLFYTAVAAPRPRRSPFLRGIWLAYAAGAVQFFGGYFFMWLSVVGAIPRPPVPVMCLFMFVGAHAQTFLNTSNVVTAVNNFPGYSGTAVGLMKGLLGLSGSILIQVYVTFLNGNPSNFLLMLSLLPTTVSLLAMFFTRIYPSKGEDDKKHLERFSSFAMIMAAYVLFIITLNNVFTPPSWVHFLTFAGILLLLASPLNIAIRAQAEDSQFSNDFIEYHALPSHDAIQEVAVSDDDKSELHLGNEMNVLQAMRTLSFWLLFVAMLGGMGAGMATVNNISQIGESLDYTTVEINTLVSLLSIWNFLGRLGSGYLSDMFLHTRGWARPVFLAITLSIMTVGLVVVASGLPGSLYVGSLLVGIAYGSQWSLMPAITSELFGVLHMGTIFNTIAVACPVGSYVLSVLVIGSFYDKQATMEGKSCHGTGCFMVSFLVLASVNVFSVLAALILFFRTRRFYLQICYKHQLCLT